MYGRIILFSALYFSYSCSALLAGDIETLAVVGRPIPSHPDFLLRDLSLYPLSNGLVIMNHEGKVVFQGQVAEYSPRLRFEGSAIFSILDGQFEPVILSGNVVPQLGKRFYFSSDATLGLSDGGHITFQGAAYDAERTESGIWEADGQTLTPIAQLSQPAPGFEDPANFVNFHYAKVNSSGDVAFLAEVNNRYSEPGLFAYQRGSLRKIAFSGEPAHGLSDDFGWFGYDAYFTIDSLGRTVYTGRTSTGPIAWDIWRDDQLLVTSGQEVSTTRQDPNFTDILTQIGTEPIISSAGAYAFVGQADTVYMGKRRASSGTYLFAGQDGSLREIVEYRQEAPEAGPDVHFYDFDQLSINSRGEVTFVASLELSSDSVWSERGENLHLVARQGDIVPGVDGDYWFTDLFAPQSNRRGQTAFYGSAQNVFSQSFLGIWAEDLTGDLQLIAAPGMEVEVAPGDIQTIRYVTTMLTNQSLPPPLYFNDRGQVLFEAMLEDGTRGIFLSNKVAVPEPATFALLALAGIVPMPRWGRCRMGSRQWDTAG